MTQAHDEYRHKAYSDETIDLLLHDPEKYFKLRQQELLETYFMGSTVNGR